MNTRWILIIVIALFAAEPAWSAKYISDVLWVSLRDAAGDSSNSIRVLRSGTELEIISEEEVEGYLNVRTQNGEEGWIKSRYLLDNPVAASKVKSLESQVSKLSNENEELKASLDKFKKDGIETDKERKRTISENKKLTQENDRLKRIAAEPEKLAQENSSLKAENARLQTEYSMAKEALDEANYDVKRTWFMTGAGVLFAGIILGLIFPNLRFRRRGTFG